MPSTCWYARCSPGDVVVVENPGYYNLFNLLKFHGVKMLGVPRTRHGPDTAALEAILLAHKPKFLFTNSMYHNPTGTSLSPSVAHRVLQLAEQHDFHIVEDDIYADFQNGPSTRLATLDSLRRVIYLASFSKTLSCSLRVGYLIAGPELIRRLADVKMYTSIGSQRFAECVVSTMLANGSYRKLVQRLRQRLTRQMAATCGCLGTTAGRCSPNRSAGCSSGPVSATTRSPNCRPWRHAWTCCCRRAAASARKARRATGCVSTSPMPATRGPWRSSRRSGEARSCPPLPHW